MQYQAKNWQKIALNLLYFAQNISIFAVVGREIALVIPLTPTIYCYDYINPIQLYVMKRNVTWFTLAGYNIAVAATSQVIDLIATLS